MPLAAATGVSKCPTYCHICMADTIFSETAAPISEDITRGQPVQEENSSEKELEDEDSRLRVRRARIERN